ncbi:hypothetical protein PHK61_31010 [Actinomycetospora lutea]|uniref:hypothetical protein n=1 Tax=Actinomycetospora lutea TaxID=663604 RepID=UPI0023670658|nr:hypothetical protein [Actinomycetospora lutea]MDD7942852.1 hypothetical protein [Actinomycetospora lutea]
MLEVAQEGTPFGIVAASVYGSLRVLKELLALKIQWDQHREEMNSLALARKRMFDEEDPFSASLLRQHKQVVGGENPLAPPPEHPEFDVEDALNNLAPVREATVIDRQGTSSARGV